MKKNIFYGLLMLLIGIYFTSCSNSDEYVQAETQQEAVVIFSETFASGLGTFTAQSVLGDQVWEGNASGYALMSGYMSATKENIANEDWLISPVIDLSKFQTANFSFDHVARYFADVATEATVWVSENYESGLPSTATWTQIKTNPFIDPGSWTFGNSGQISLTAYAGKKIHIAFKYLSTATKAGSWEIKNFSVSSGEVVVINHTYGEGTKDSPYTVLGGSLNQNNKSAWVKGYVVGYIWYANGGNQYYFGADTCTQTTNLMISDSLGHTYLSQCMAVQLPAGAVRTGLNLKDNKSLIGKKVTMYGLHTAYFGMAGLKNTSYYILEDGTSGGTKPVYPFYSEGFISSQGQFTVENKVLPAGFTSIWLPTSYGMTASAFKSGTFASESWLISPAINLSGHTSVGLSFDHTINKGLVANMKTEQTMWITTDNGANWTQLTIPTYPAGTNWTFVNSGDVDLNAYLGKTVKIAFKYLSTTASCASWEIKNFQVYDR